MQPNNRIFHAAARVNPLAHRNPPAAGRSSATRQMIRNPWYTDTALSLRNPAFISRTRSVFFSSSFCGSIAAPTLANVSAIWPNRGFDVCASRSSSTRDFGRPILSSRSSAMLFRREIADNSQNVPAMIPTNTNTGNKSSTDRKPNSGVTARLPGGALGSRSGPFRRRPGERPGSHLDVHDLPDRERPDDHQDDREHRHPDPRRVRPQQLHVVRLHPQQ